jgi:hypothetical protein
MKMTWPRMPVEESCWPRAVAVTSSNLEASMPEVADAGEDHGYA